MSNIGLFKSYFSLSIFMNTIESPFITTSLVVSVVTNFERESKYSVVVGKRFIKNLSRGYLIRVTITVNNVFTIRVFTMLSVKIVATGGNTISLISIFGTIIIRSYCKYA